MKTMTVGNLTCCFDIDSQHQLERYTHFLHHRQKFSSSVEIQVRSIWKSWTKSLPGTYSCAKNCSQIFHTNLLHSVFVLIYFKLSLFKSFLSATWFKGCHLKTTFTSISQPPLWMAQLWKTSFNGMDGEANKCYVPVLNFDLKHHPKVRWPILNTQDFIPVFFIAERQHCFEVKSSHLFLMVNKPI